MYDVPPPAIESYALYVDTTNTQGDLLIKVEEAQYDAKGKMATVFIKDAFETAQIINAHNGMTVTLIYKSTPSDLGKCPNVHVSLDQIKRNINFLRNAVSLDISNIDQTLANKIEEAQCLNVDTQIVKDVVNLKIEPPNAGND